MAQENNQISDTAKLFARRLAYLGLILGLFYSIGGAIYDLLYAGGFNTGTYLAFMAIVGMPLMLGIIGYLLGLLVALVIQNKANL